MHPANACGVVIGLLLIACGSSDEGALRRAHGVMGVTSNDAGDGTSGEAGPATGGARSFAGSAGAPTPTSAGGSGSGGAGASTAMGAGAPSGGMAPGDGGRAGDAGAPPGDDAGARDGDVTTATGGSAGCAVRRVWYGDGDGDGFGDMAMPMVGCTAPATTGRVENSDDCDDHDARVHPGQAAYFGEAYRAAGDIPSFDYDCSGDEAPDPAQQAAPTSCGLLSIANCAGSGYLPTTRKGPGVNPLCGSVQISTCSLAALVLCQAVTSTASDAARCH